MTIKLLVADDSVTIQKIVSLAFSGEDILIEAASDGNTALELVRSFKPDIVLADVFMPGCSGYEVCERMKEDLETADTPVVLMVGTFEPFDESEASRVKCDGFLTKPFDTSELIRTVHALVRREDNSPVELSEAVPQRSTDDHGASDTPAGAKRIVSSATLESFLGKNRILDIVDSETVIPAAGADRKPARTNAVITEDQINLIVDRVIRKMSADVIREVAWEVVPELSESIIRSTMEEHKN